MRFTQEVNIQLFGDRSVAVQYIGLARKLLGGLQTYNHDLSPITREGITSRTHKTPDGALIQVIWFPWQPVIKIFPPGFGAERGRQEQQKCAVERPIHHWPFDDSTADTGSVGGWDASDCGGFGDVSPPLSYTDGKVSRAARTQRVNGTELCLVNYDDGTPHNLDTFTFSYWFNLEWAIQEDTATNDNSGAGWLQVMDAYSDTDVGPFDYTQFYTVLNRTEELEWSVTTTVEGLRGTGFRDFRDEATKPYVPGQWCNIAVTADGSSMQFYFNGAPWFTSSERPQFPGWYFYGPNPGSFYQFYTPIVVPYSMLVDDWAVWDKPLRPDQIKQLAAGTPASELCV